MRIATPAERLGRAGPGRAAALAVVACLALPLAGCSSSTPAFDLTAPRQAVRGGGLIGGQLVVAEPAAIQPLEDERILARDAAGSVSYIGGAQWADRLPRLFQARLLQTFENASRIRAVARPGEGVTAEYQLNTDIRAFQLDSSRGRGLRRDLGEGHRRSVRPASSRRRCSAAGRRSRTRRDRPSPRCSIACCRASSSTSSASSARRADRPRPLAPGVAAPHLRAVATNPDGHDHVEAFPRPRRRLRRGAGRATRAFAQTSRTATIQPGKPARVAVVTALKNDCSLGEVGSIRVTTPPKSGSLVVRGGKLKTPGSFRCPNVETPVQALFYEPNKNFQGQDEVAYETRSTDGNVQSFTLKITVSAKPPAKPSTGGVQDL